MVEIRKTLSKLKPKIVHFILSIDKEGKPSGMVADWATTVSYNPPLIAVALNKKGFTHKLIQQSKEFVVSIATKDLEHAISSFGYVSGEKIDKFKKTDLKTLPAKKIKTPILKEAKYNFECKLNKEIDVGDHFLYVGEVVQAHENSKKEILLNFGRKNNIRIFGTR